MKTLENVIYEGKISWVGKSRPKNIFCLEKNKMNFNFKYILILFKIYTTVLWL